MKPKPPNLFTSGRIHAVSVSGRKGEVKHNVAQARLLVEHGLEGDAHAEGGIRQVSLLALASIDKMVAVGRTSSPAILPRTSRLKVCRLWTCRWGPGSRWAAR